MRRCAYCCVCFVLFWVHTCRISTPWLLLLTDAPPSSFNNLVGKPDPRHPSLAPLQAQRAALLVPPLFQLAAGVAQPAHATALVL